MEQQTRPQQTAAIVIDSWKLKTFKKRLNSAGYQFEKHPGPTQKTLTLKVKVETLTDGKFQMLVRNINDECRRSRMH